MPQFRSFSNNFTRALFLLLWTVVFLVRVGAVDHRALQGNLARNAPSPHLALRSLFRHH